MSPSSQTSSPVAVKPTKIIIEHGDFVRSPIRRGMRTHSIIAMRECTIPELDPTCFMSDPNLAIVNFKDSTVNFSAFIGGLFGKECTALTYINLSNTRGIDLKLFIEKFADSGLLDLILKGTCTLKINRASDDTAQGSEGGVTPKPAEVYSDAEIQTMIRAFREIRSSSTSTAWWMVSTLTLGLLGVSESKQTESGAKKWHHSDETWCHFYIKFEHARSHRDKTEEK